MKIFGRPIADRILESIQKEIEEKNLKPALAILYVGNNPNSKSYITYKIKAANKVGIINKLFHFSEDQKSQLLKKIVELNNDSKIHGMILQLPLPKNWETDRYVQTIAKEKDVDGFINGSPFFGATAEGILEMISEFGRLEGKNNIEDFLKGKNIVIVGKGITAGRPTIDLLRSKGYHPEIVDSKTKNPDAVIRAGDVVIGASGIKNIINKDNIKKGAYVVAVGVVREIIDGKEVVSGDVDENIAGIARMYCPTLGGIGPLTIACLLKNVLKAYKMSNQ